MRFVQLTHKIAQQLHLRSRQCAGLVLGQCESKAQGVGAGTLLRV